MVTKVLNNLQHRVMLWIVGSAVFMSNCVIKLPGLKDMWQLPAPTLSALQHCADRFCRAWSSQTASVPVLCTLAFVRDVRACVQTQYLPGSERARERASERVRSHTHRLIGVFEVLGFWNGLRLLLLSPLGCLMARIIDRGSSSSPDLAAAEATRHAQPRLRTCGSRSRTRCRRDNCHCDAGCYTWD